MSRFVTFMDPNQDERFHAGERFKRGQERQMSSAWVREHLLDAYDYPGAWRITRGPSQEDVPTIEEAIPEIAPVEIASPPIESPAPKPSRFAPPKARPKVAPKKKPAPKAKKRDA